MHDRITVDTVVLKRAMNTDPDALNILTVCPECNEARSVSCSRVSIENDAAIVVAAILCGHFWELPRDEIDLLRKRLKEGTL